MPGRSWPAWSWPALLPPHEPRTVGLRCGPAQPHVEAFQGWSDLGRRRRGFRFAGLLRWPEPLPGQCPAVHAVPAGQAFPGVLQAGMDRSARGQRQQAPGPGEGHIALAGIVEVRDAVKGLEGRSAGSRAGVRGPPGPHRNCNNPGSPRSPRPTPGPWPGEWWWR